MIILELLYKERKKLKKIKTKIPQRNPIQSLQSHQPPESIKKLKARAEIQALIHNKYKLNLIIKIFNSGMIKSKIKYFRILVIMMSFCFL